MIFFDENGKGKFFITGSYNMTNNANYNWEDIVILNNEHTIERYIQRHQTLLAYCSDFQEYVNDIPDEPTNKQEMVINMNADEHSYQKRSSESHQHSYKPY